MNPDAFRDFLAQLRDTAVAPRRFETWKTVKLGTGLKTADSFRRAFGSLGYAVSEEVDGALSRGAIAVSDVGVEVELVRVLTGEIGGNTFEEFCDWILRCGLSLCSPEVGLQLRLQYHEQCEGETLLVAMDPIVDPDGGDEGVFHIARNGDSRRLQVAALRRLSFPNKHSTCHNSYWVLQRRN